MRISDWSSDVCSSDLPAHRDVGFLIGDALVVEQPLGARAIAAECLGVDFDLCHAFRGVARSGACQSCGSPASTRAQHKTVTRAAPALRSARVQASAVAPLVWTSSIRTTRLPPSALPPSTDNMRVGTEWVSTVKLRWAP